MANYRTFHSQLTSIMETLTRAAVAEVCELVDDGYAVLHLEISRHQKENEELRQKLTLIESIIARGAGGGGGGGGGGAATEKIIAARDSRGGRDGLGRGKLVMMEEYTSRDVEESQPITVRVKQEEPDQHGTGEDGEVGDVTQDSLGEDVEEVDTSMRPHTHTHTHTHTRADSLDTHTRPDSLDTHTLSRADSLDAHAHTHSCPDSEDTHTHTHSALELSSAILLESDEENTLADSTLDSHTHSDAHTDSDTHTHSDAFSDVQHTPSDAAQDTHTRALDTHAQALSFLDRVCVKREGGASSGVCELVADWRSRHALTHTHTHALSHTHTHTHGLSSSSSLNAAHPALFSLLPHAHTHTHTHAHTHGQAIRAGVGGTVGVCKRSFICAFCGKSFTTAQSLDTHTRIHTGERPFRCGQCGKRFTQSGHLTAHQTVHTGERPYPCSYCAKRFAGKQYLRIHMRKHHPDQHTHTS